MVVAVLALAPGSAHAGSIFIAHLSGTQETPPNPSPGTGEAVVTLNNAATQISVALNWEEIFSGATAADIHEGAPGQRGSIFFPLKLGGGAGEIDGSIDPSSQVFNITPAQVAALEHSLLYIDLHSSDYPAGEIRGQFLASVAEPKSLVPAATAMVLGLVGYAWRCRARRAQSR
jgi:hypothetical protein